MLEKTILEILYETWPMLLIFTIIISSMRITYIVKNKVKFILYKEILSLLFIIYILCLFHTVTFQDVSWSTSNFIPFKEMFRYEFLSPMFIKNVLGNMLMFIPYGFFVSYFLKLKKPYSIFFLSLLTSLTIEITQLLIGRVFDVDDIMLNIFGGMIGFSFYYLINTLKSNLPELLKKPIVYNIIIIVLMLCTFLYFINI